MSANAYLSQIFGSIQGEGLYVGERQIFLRFIGCNISCAYCDIQDLSKDEKSACIFKNGNEIKEIKNPISVLELQKLVESFDVKSNLFHSIAITGGEPLLQVDFLKEFLPKIKKKKYLETNGILFNNLEEIIDETDIIAMDIKLESATGCAPYFEEHKKFLKVANMQEVFVKIVFSGSSSSSEILKAVELIEEEDPCIPLVLAPISMHRSDKKSKKATPDQCLNFQAIAKKHLEKVLVIPQVHKILGVD